MLNRVEQIEEISLEQVHNQQAHPMVLCSYLLVFTSGIGLFSIYDHLTLIWMPMAFLGGILLVTKNSFLSSEQQRKRVFTLDILAVALVAIFGLVLPDYIGLLKLAILASISCTHMAIICRKGFTGYHAASQLN